MTPSDLTVADWWKGGDVSTEAIHPFQAFAAPDTVRRWHAQGRRVIVYAVNDAVRSDGGGLVEGRRCLDGGHPPVSGVRRARYRAAMARSRPARDRVRRE